VKSYDRAGQVWLNDDQPTSWSLVLVLQTEAFGDTIEHRVAVLDAGRESGYEPGDTPTFEELPTEGFEWDTPGENGCMRRVL